MNANPPYAAASRRPFRDWRAAGRIVAFGPMNRLALAAVLCSTLLAAPRLALADGVPVRVRVLEGSRQGPAQVDPAVSDLKSQLSLLSYQRWRQVQDDRRQLEPGKTTTFTLPNGSPLELTVLEAKKDSVTFQLRVPSHQISSRLKISKEQRIVYQVTPEKNGAALFVSVRPWG